MAFWKFRAWLSNWIGRAIFAALLIGLVFLGVYCSGFFKTIWAYLDHMMSHRF